MASSISCFTAVLNSDLFCTFVLQISYCALPRHLQWTIQFMPDCVAVESMTCFTDRTAASGYCV